MLYYLFLLIDPKAFRQPLYVILSHVALIAFLLIGPKAFR